MKILLLRVFAPTQSPFVFKKTETERKSLFLPTVQAIEDRYLASLGDSEKCKKYLKAILINSCKSHHLQNKPYIQVTLFR